MNGWTQVHTGDISESSTWRIIGTGEKPTGNVECLGNKRATITLEPHGTRFRCSKLTRGSRNTFFMVGELQCNFFMLNPPPSRTWPDNRPMSGARRPWAQNTPAGEQARGAGQRRAGDGEMDELVGGAAGVPRQRHGRAGDGTCDRAVLLQEEGGTN